MISGLLLLIILTVVFLIATPQGKFLHQIGFPGVQTEEGFQCPYAKHGDDDKMGGGKCSNKYKVWK